MGDNFLTLKDLAARMHTDDLVGLIENVVTVAPEIDRVMGRPIPGISYLARVRTEVAQNAAFRKINSGVATSSSHITQQRFNMFPFDCEMRVDEFLVEQGEAEGDSMGKILAEEASGAMLAKAIALGKQFYQGTVNDANGCPGLIDFLTTQQQIIDSRTNHFINQVVDAGGSSAGNCENVWFINASPQGVHWLFGRNLGLQMRPWFLQQVTSQDSVGKAMAWCSNVRGWVGTSMANYHAVGAILNVDNNSATPGPAPLTDALVARLWAKFPIHLKPNMCFATQRAIESLQVSRTVTIQAQLQVAGASRSDLGSVAPWPTVLPTAGNIPIIPTDSILLGNQDTTHNNPS